VILFAVAMPRRVIRCDRGSALDAETESNPQNRRLGYAHVSTYGQTLDAQLEQLRAEGCAKIYREKASGSQADRRELLRMLNGLAPDEVVTVTHRPPDLRPFRHR
jgi:predicted site-specific integrase-resolvase